MITKQNLQFELEGRFTELGLPTKHHISVRWEPGPGIVRVGAMIADYTWDNRMAVLEMLVGFEHDHSDELAVEFDIVPLEAVTDEEFAEA